MRQALAGDWPDLPDPAPGELALDMPAQLRRPLRPGWPVPDPARQPAHRRHRHGAQPPWPAAASPTTRDGSAPARIQGQPSWPPATATPPAWPSTPARNQCDTCGSTAPASIPPRTGRPGNQIALARVRASWSSPPGAGGFLRVPVSLIRAAQPVPGSHGFLDKARVDVGEPELAATDQPQRAVARNVAPGVLGPGQGDPHGGGAEVPGGEQATAGALVLQPPAEATCSWPSPRPRRRHGGARPG